MPRVTLDTARAPFPSLTRLSRPLVGLSSSILLGSGLLNAVRTPWCSHHGLGSSAFARRYLRNHSYFLFLRLLRCFSSPGSLLQPMYSVADDRSLSGRVSPFRYPRIKDYLHLPVAFRSLSRLSSALSAKASTLRSCSLDLFVLLSGAASLACEAALHLQSHGSIEEFNSSCAGCRFTRKPATSKYFASAKHLDIWALR